MRFRASRSVHELLLRRTTLPRRKPSRSLGHDTSLRSARHGSTQDPVGTAHATAENMVFEIENTLHSARTSARRGVTYPLVVSIRRSFDRRRSSDRTRNSDRNRCFDVKSARSNHVSTSSRGSCSTNDIVSNHGSDATSQRLVSIRDVVVARNQFAFAGRFRVTPARNQIVFDLDRAALARSDLGTRLTRIWQTSASAHHGKKECS